MPQFDVWDHATNRAISFQISDVLDNTAGRAVERACQRFGVAPHQVRIIAMAVTNGLHAGVDSSIAYHVKGRQFRSWDMALNFLVKEIQDLLRDELDNHRHHFVLPQSTRDDDGWRNVVGFVGSETIALLKAMFAPRPPARPGY